MSFGMKVEAPRDLDLSNLEANVRRAVENAIAGSMKLVENEAKRAIARGEKSGRVYRRRGIEHQASAPGQAPAQDTGILAASIVSGVDGLKGIVEVRADYARHLEFGTRHIAPRPFLFPAVEANRNRVESLIRSAVVTALKRYAEKPANG